MFFFSKSKYCDFKQCPKIAWLKKYRPELYVIDDATAARFATGTEVGNLAKGLFGDYCEATARTSDGKLDLTRMKWLTHKFVSEGKDVICEAAFDYSGLYCAVDILRKTQHGYDIYEVKSSTDPFNRAYITDTGYQRYVLEKCGVEVGRVFVVTIDTSYVFDGKLDIKKLFKITDVTDLSEEVTAGVADDIKTAEKILSCKTEPDIDVSENCNDPYPCAFFGYCTRGLPTPSVFDLYRLGFDKKIELYRRGVRSFGDILNDGFPLGEIRLRQVQFALENRGTYIDKAGISSFLNKLSYPLYFLDFETVRPAVPEYTGTHPYQQIPVQYSLHILHGPSGELEHREFLGRPEEDPRRALAERLVFDIPADACVIAYASAFECGRIRELAAVFPDLAEKLLKIEGNIVDLLEPFRKGYYYNAAMGGSFSIKSVLPAVYPDDESLNYHNLEGVHNGVEAMELFPKLKSMTEEERSAAERNLLKYCELDTYAMVKLYEELIKSVAPAA